MNASPRSEGASHSSQRIPEEIPSESEVARQRAKQEMRRRREALRGAPMGMCVWMMLLGLAIAARYYQLIRLPLITQNTLTLVITAWLTLQYLYFRTQLFRQFPWSVGTADLGFTTGHMILALTMALLDGFSPFGVMLITLLGPTSTAFLGLNVGFRPTLWIGASVQTIVLLAYLLDAPASALSPVLIGFFWVTWWVSWLIGATANGNQQNIKHRITTLLRVQRENHSLIQEQTEALDEKGRALEQANMRLHQLSMIDGLTGVANRRRFDESLHEEWRRSQRAIRDHDTGHQPTPHEHMALLLIDIDYFKQYNDHYGHVAGDECLQEVARLISSGVRRSGDLAARYGGEEFAILLPATTLSGAFGVAERIRRMVWQHGILHEASPLGRVSICIGVAATPEAACSVETELIRLADAALYAAKRNGRNQVMQAFFEGFPSISAEDG